MQANGKPAVVPRLPRPPPPPKDDVPLCRIGALSAAAWSAVTSACLSALFAWLAARHSLLSSRTPASLPGVGWEPYQYMYFQRTYQEQRTGAPSETVLMALCSTSCFLVLLTSTALLTRVAYTLFVWMFSVSVLIKAVALFGYCALAWTHSVTFDGPIHEKLSFFCVATVVVDFLCVGVSVYHWIVAVKRRAPHSVTLQTPFPDRTPFNSIPTRRLGSKYPMGPPSEQESDGDALYQ